MMKKITALVASVFTSLLFTAPALAETAESAPHTMDISPLHPAALLCVGLFVLAYTAVLFEEKTHLRKSKPVMLGAGLIWIVIGIIAPAHGVTHDQLHDAVFHGLGEYASLMLFLLAAMTFICTLQERLVFDELRERLVQANLNFRQLFWATGVTAFFLSPIADNMTTALVMGAVVMAVGSNNPKFVALSCINIVVAANAGGAFSPFGDITTLMVWQAGHVEFFEFFALFLPSVVNFLVPAAIMSIFVSNEMPEALAVDRKIKRGGKLVIALGLGTIALAVVMEQVLGLPAFLGMMTGLSALMVTMWYIRVTDPENEKNLDMMGMVAKAEWDTLLFFFGVIFAVGGLSFLGYMHMTSVALYGGLGHTSANIIMGLASAVIDNIPIMFAVLTMDPEMSHFQWMLVTLTTGVGGSMLSVGSAAGVALMGVAHGKYTFMGHLKWTPVIALGYAASIWVHFLLNGQTHNMPG